MVKHRKQKACTSSVHKKGHFVEVKARCHVGKAKLTTPSTCKRVLKKSTIKHKTKRTEVPAACKGKKHGATRNKCVRDICAQRPAEYRKDCMKKAGLRKV